MRHRNYRPFTMERLKELLTYEPETGLFTWNKKRKGVDYDGAPAGAVNQDGYVQISIDNKVYLGHRLAWFWMTGEWPKSHLDHKSRIRTDNRWGNLRPASRAQNTANTRVRVDSITGFKGVMLDPRQRPWLAYISIDDVLVPLGHFPTKEEAAAAYDAAAVKHFGEFAATNADLLKACG